ncbi:MAG: IgGFc-binding protein [Myxococcales bacterium]|nr:IgGFc-binding protein [Myxococcales bacterium]MCB9582376.1 IgGFc-binding protein [Polyangiaceae bacterium]
MKTGAALGCALSLGLAAVASCSADSGNGGGGGSSGFGGFGGDASVTDSAPDQQTLTDGGGLDVGPLLDAPSTDGGCSFKCSTDFHSVLSCTGVELKKCTGTEGCDPTTGQCQNACAVAEKTKQSVGCEYYPTFMEMSDSTFWTDDQTCFSVIVANTWDTPAHITVELGGSPINVDNFAYVPNGSGPSLTLTPTSVTNGLAPGGVAILFLAGAQGSEKAHCPVPAAMTTGPMVHGTGISNSFHLKTDVPVVAYQVNPYGGGNAAVTGSSLLIPTSAWDTNYIGVNAYKADITPPSMNIIAKEDDTTVTMVPVAAVTGGGGLPSGAVNTPLSFKLNAGQQAQFSQNAELTGSVLSSDKPIGVMAGQKSLRVPVGVAYADHAEQMIPPVRAMGSEYVGVMHRQRKSEPAVWRMVGAVDGTQLTWSTSVGGPTTLDRGQVAEFQSSTPFMVKSQDDDHPFMVFELMTGSTFQASMNGYGDADFVFIVPTEQYMTRYVFFTDPTYPETNLVLVRKKVDGQFADVNLDCAGVVSGWQPIGDYEWTRVDLMTGNFQPVGGCSTGRREMWSDGPFGVTVWGWGTPETTSFTSNVSYGYPAGMNIVPINKVIVPPVPR